MTTARRTSPRYVSASASAAIPTNTGGSLSLSMRTVPISVSITHLRDFRADVEGLRHERERARVELLAGRHEEAVCVALRLVVDHAVTPPASRPSEISARMLPATMATILPAVHFLAGGAASAPVASWTVAGLEQPRLVAIRSPWSSRNGG